MDYISAEEFLKQPEEVQKVFLDRWKSNCKETDLCINSATTPGNIDILKNQLGIVKLYPLLTEGQLRHFIEDKGYKYIGINNFLENKWNIRAFKSMVQFEPTIELICGTPLDCYWQVACKIAEGVYHG